jgi:hypothetical protein
VTLSNEDYTQLEVGTQIGNEKIETCPHCKRAGLAHVVNDVTFFIHAQRVKVNKDGTFEAVLDDCPRPNASKKSQKTDAPR